MKKPRIVLVDSDEEYLMPIVMKITSELKDSVEIEIITSKDYFHEFLSRLQTITVLFINGEWYNKELEKHNIQHVFLMKSSLEDMHTRSGRIHYVEKYSSVKELYNQMMYECSRELILTSGNKNNTKVILVYSPIGGSGKTLLSLSLSACLEKMHKRCFYIDAEYLQTFQIYMKDKECMPRETGAVLAHEEKSIAKTMYHYKRRDLFDYLPPFFASISALNISFSVYASLIKYISELNEYDYIIVDTDSVYNEEKNALIDLADYVLMPLFDDDASFFCMQQLGQNLNIKDKDKFLLVRNSYKITETEDHSNDRHQPYQFSANICWLDTDDRQSIEKIAKSDSISKLAYRFI